MFEFNPWVFLALVVFTIVNAIGYLVARHHREEAERKEQELKNILDRLSNLEGKQ